MTNQDDPNVLGDECAIATAEFEPVDLSTELVALEPLCNLSDDEIEGLGEGHEAVLGLEAFLAPGGDWGGSRAPAERAAHIGSRNGLQITSRKRSSGNAGSDHHVSQRAAYGVDMSNGSRPTPQMLRTARQIAAAMGYSWPSNGYLQTATTSRGYRAQLIYDSSVVPHHENHVHFGVKKVR